MPVSVTTSAQKEGTKNELFSRILSIRLYAASYVPRHGLFGLWCRLHGRAVGQGFGQTRRLDLQ